MNNSCARNAKKALRVFFVRVFETEILKIKLGNAIKESEMA
jgi:hypothetical protein